MGSLTAFPADGYTARWQTADHEHHETLTLRWENEAWTAIGEVTREKVSYVLRLSPTWNLRQLLVFRDASEPDLWLGTDGSGRWGEVNGAHRTDLDGCDDVDLRCTPFTNTVPIRRLQLGIGASADVKAAMVDVETLGVVPVRQRYERISDRRYAYTNVDSGFSAVLDVDAYGLVLDYPEQFERI